MLKEYGKRLEEYSKNERDDYMDTALNDYLREYELRLGGYLTGKDEGKEEGIEKGRNAEKMEITKNMINQNFGYEVISKITGLSIPEIEEIVKKNKDKN